MPATLPSRASAGLKPAERAADRRSALRAALSEAAEQAIARRGLAALNARDLAAEVGCSVGAIYNVFPDLDAVVYEVNTRTLTLIERFLQRRLRGKASAAPGDVLVGLAVAYLDFAATHRPRWRALFEHTPAARGTVPETYRAEQARIFGVVERPLARLRPDLDRHRIVQLSRTIFSAVHGVVVLGLDEKLGSLPVATLRRQLRDFVAVLAGALPAPGGTAAGKNG